MQPIAEPWRWVACSVVAVFAFCSGSCQGGVVNFGCVAWAFDVGGLFLQIV